MSDNPIAPLLNQVSDLDGAGPKLSAYLTRLIGGDRLLDLVFFTPRRWVYRERLNQLSEDKTGQEVIITGQVTKIDPPFRPSAPYRVQIELSDEQSFTCVYFRADRNWLAKQFPEGMWRSVSGKLEVFRDQYQITHPDKVGTPDESNLWPLCEPVYGQTANLSQKRIQAFARQAVDRVPADLPEWIDGPLIAKQNWPSFINALKLVHGVLPGDDDARQGAALRLAYDEALFRARLQAQSQAVRAKQVSKIYRPAIALEAEFQQSLNFIPTGAQTRANRTIADDLKSGKPMRRLVQGDVGSGKTLVGAFAALPILAGGGQVAFMAPTEVLARQQFETFSSWFGPLGFEVALLTGRDKASLRHATKIGLVDGSIQMVVGTHALFQKDVEFSELGLIIIDELHRFGVSDREKLRQKGHMPHILVMSATPIPRSVAQILHGDLDITILDEKPAGRQEIDTRILSDQKIDSVVAAIGRALQRGEQAYWVCPRLEEVDEGQASAIARAKHLKQVLGTQISLVHGQMPSDKKQEALDDFRQGRSRLLVATTVIEVGVDVPNATIMVIEGANSFGLAQLHQLRGRVGRGSAQSFCLMLYTPPLTESGRTRLDVLRETNDGFIIAEKDFELRGPGDVLGLKQSGDTPLRFLDPRLHNDLIEIARTQAKYEVTRQLDKNTGFIGQDILKTMYAAQPKIQDE